MRDTSAVCSCCGKREQAGQCVKGMPMCSCERGRGFLSLFALQCSKCRKCPVHCGCFDAECRCDKDRLSFLGHDSDCSARIKSREQIVADKRSADSRLQALLDEPHDVW